MRQIVLDTETTGLDSKQGHRIIEIGAVEVINRKITGEKFHQYVNPQRDIDAGAQEVHGISLESLQDKPLFADIFADFLNFVDGAELIIHNAPFDIGFLNAELKRLSGKQKVMADYCTVLDSLILARNMHPGQKNNLDALCRRYHVNSFNRELHGALLDADILAEVYLLMTGGQVSLGLTEDSDNPNTSLGAGVATKFIERNDVRIPIIKATEQELDTHRQYLERLQSETGKVLWLES